EDPDQHAAPVVGRMPRAKLIDPCARERHQPGHQRHGGGQRRLLPPCRGVWRSGGRGCDGRSFGGLRPCGRYAGRPGGAGGAEGGKNEREWADGHVSLGRTKGTMCGPVNSVVSSSRKAMVSRVSSGDRKSTRLNSSHVAI